MISTHKLFSFHCFFFIQITNSLFKNLKFFIISLFQLHSQLSKVFSFMSWLWCFFFFFLVVVVVQFSQPLCLVSEKGEEEKKK